MGYYDFSYYGILLISAILGFATQTYINTTYKKWSQVAGTRGGSGADVARRMLDANGANNVGITRIAGHLTDNYDPRDNMLHLSEENFSGGSVASVAVACHEAGHAVQRAQNYVPVQIRTALFPIVNITQQTWSIVFILGIMFNIMGFVNLAIILFAFSVAFQLVTLPVEIDASRRAVAYLGQTGGGIDQQGAKKVLTAAALTYVAAALMSIIQLFYLIGRANNRRR